MFLPGFELATFRSRVRRSYQQAVLAPGIMVIIMIMAVMMMRMGRWRRGGMRMGD